MSGHVRPCQAMSGHVRPCQAMSGHVRPYQAMSGHVRPCQAMSGHVRPCQAMSGLFGEESGVLLVTQGVLWQEAAVLAERALRTFASKVQKIAFFAPSEALGPQLQIFLKSF